MFLRVEKLNGWQRIGVVLSVVWAIGGVGWGFNIAYIDVEQNYSQCRAGANALYIHTANETSEWGKALEQCDLNHVNQNEDAAFYGSVHAVFIGLLPIPIGWFAVYKSIALLRWIREGFKK
jgi:hypothetical protein